MGRCCEGVETLAIMVPGTRIELVRGQASRDFKSLASTSSATQAFLTFSSLYHTAFQKKSDTLCSA